MWAAVVCHGEAEWMPSHGMDEFTVQRAATGFAQTPGLLSESANCVAELGAPACQMAAVCRRTPSMDRECAQAIS